MCVQQHLHEFGLLNPIEIAPGTSVAYRVYRHHKTCQQIERKVKHVVVCLFSTCGPQNWTNVTQALSHVDFQHVSTERRLVKHFFHFFSVVQPTLV